MTLVLYTAPAHATFPGLVGQYVAFQSNRDGDNDIYTTLTGNPTMATKLTNNTSVDENPAWSPDGTKIVFHSNRDGNLEIYTMNADGTGQTRITNNAAFDELPAWSPDGTKIVFDSGRDDPHGEIYTMNADGTNVTRLTNDPGYDFGSQWSTDGAKIAWQSSRTSNQYDVYSMNVDGTVQTNLTNNTSAADIQPDWSPDGTKIAFASNSGGPYDIYLMNPDGTGKLAWSPVNSPADEVSPAFQPDWKANSGGVLAARYNAGDTASDIYRNNVQESNGSSTGAIDEAADWQPINRSYARPRGATPVRISLVPSYVPCASPTTTHRGAITKPSCYGPTPESNYLTVGSPEFNNLQPNSIGFALFRVRTAAPEDGTIQVSITDVRCKQTSTGCSGGALSDYSGSLQFEANFRITDKNNGPTGFGASANGTVTETPLSFVVPCTTTAATNVGSTCSVTASIDAVLGGATAVDDGKRAIWEMAAFSDGRVIRLSDGGADGNGATAGNTIYAAGGLFFP